MSKKVILLDFDGTLAKWDGNYTADQLGEPLERARQACFILEREFRLVCFTTRPAFLIEGWLRKYGFPTTMKVSTEKIPAYLQIDDRAIRFEGEWTDELLEQIRSFKPWWKE